MRSQLTIRTGLALCSAIVGTALATPAAAKAPQTQISKTIAQCVENAGGILDIVGFKVPNVSKAIQDIRLCASQSKLRIPADIEGLLQQVEKDYEEHLARHKRVQQRASCDDQGARAAELHRRQQYIEAVELYAKVQNCYASLGFKDLADMTATNSKLAITGARINARER